jgi:glycosyltransferase involved in cell wall biosynthesis
VKILQAHQEIRLEAGGVTRAILDLCQALAASGRHEVTLLTCDPQDVPDSWSAAAGTPRTVGIALPRLPGGLYAPGDLRSLRDHLSRADVVHLHGMWSPFNDQLARVAHRLGLPYVYSVHGMLDRWSMTQHRLRKRLYLALRARRILERAAAVHCTATGELEQARLWFSGDRALTIPLIFDARHFQAAPGPEVARRAIPDLDDDVPAVLFVSRLHYKKGVELLLQAAALLHERGVRCRTLIAGSGDSAYESSLRSLARELGVDGVVRFLGFVRGPVKTSLFRAAHVFVLPTSQENFGYALFEALAAATPVITTRGVDTWPELESSGGAVIVPRDPQAIAEGIEAILGDERRRGAMGADGRAWVLEHLSEEALLPRYESMYAAAASE